MADVLERIGGVRSEVGEWQSRPLEEVYAVMYFDAVRVKIRDEGLVRNKAVYLAIGLLGAHQTGQLTCYNSGQTICS